MESRSRGQQWSIADGSGNEGTESDEGIGGRRRDGAGVLILNPVSGGGDHGEFAHSLAVVAAAARGIQYQHARSILSPVADALVAFGPFVTAAIGDESLLPSRSRFHSSR